MAYIAEPYGPPTAAPVLPKSVPIDITRYASLDTLKGVAILLAWVVSATLADSNISPLLKPGGWKQVSVADCVFPALLLGIGVALSLSALFGTEQHENLGRFYLRALSRTFWILLFGVIVESAVARHPVFDLGSLQLIGIAYFLNALLARTPLLVRVFLAEALLLAFYGWVRMNQVPGTLAGTFNDKVNFIRYYDSNVLSPIGLHGLLNLVGMTSVMMSGTVLGNLYVMEDSRWRRGLIFVAIGTTLSFFGWLWSLDMAMSSAIWTSSYALFGTGVAIVALGIFNLMFDFQKGDKVAYPLIVPGTSIILALVGPPIFQVMILDVWHMTGATQTMGVSFRHWIATNFNPPLTSWVYPVLFVVVWWIVLAITFARRKWLREKCDTVSIIKI